MIGRGEVGDVVAASSTARPAKAMLGSGNRRIHPAVVESSETWSVRDPKKFDGMRAARPFEPGARGSL